MSDTQTKRANRYSTQANFVPPSETQLARRVDSLPGLTVTNAVEPTELPAIAPTVAVERRDSAVTHAKGTILQSLPVLAIFLPVTGALTGLAWLYGLLDFPGFGAWLGTTVLVWGIAALTAYWFVVRDANRHSAPGVERHRIDRQADVLVEKIRSDERVRIAGFTAYLRLLGVKDDELD